MSYPHINGSVRQPMYTKVIAEDVETGTLVLSMKASDRDEVGTPNSRITYRLEGEGADDFAIDSVRGMCGYMSGYVRAL